MNAKQLITLSALVFAAGTALADDITVVNDSFKSQRSRAEVQAEVKQARAAGVLNFVVEVERTAPVAASMLTREQVRAELKSTPQPRAVIYNPAA
jgi:Domain of unknown function (DUF4148)